MNDLKFALGGLVLLILGAAVQKSLSNDLTNGFYKRWKVFYVLINDKEMTANEVTDLSCLKTKDYIFYENKTFRIDTTCGKKQYSPLVPYSYSNNILILNNDTMEVVELNSNKLKLRKKIPVYSDSVTISPETAFVNFDIILYPNIEN